MRDGEIRISRAQLAHAHQEMVGFDQLECCFIRENPDSTVLIETYHADGAIRRVLSERDGAGYVWESEKAP